MFDTKQFEKINPQYFNIIMLSEYDVTIQSRNTGHYWYLHNTDYPAEGNCVIFHKHKASHPYHLHGRAGTLPQAVRSIKKHDKWQPQLIELWGLNVQMDVEAKKNFVRQTVK